MVAAATAAATTSLPRAGSHGSGRRAHCWPTATPEAAATISSATHTGPSGGVGTAASTGSAGMSPPNTVNELNVANPTCALEPTATAAVPTITFGAYNTDSTVRLNCPKTESVIAYRSCIVDQCTTIDPTATTPESPTSASTPAAAARNASGSQSGRGESVRARRPTREPTPIAAPMACTASTLQNARSAFGVCSSVSTDAASWTTASDIAAISSGPPSAEATTQRMTNHDAPGDVAVAVVRAVPHTINSTGSSGITPSSLPPMETGTRCTPSHMLAIAPSAPVISLLAMSNCSSTTAAMMTSATTDGPNATLSSSRAWRVPTGRLSTPVTVPRKRLHARDRHACGPDYDGVGPDCCGEDDCCGCAGTLVVGAEDGCGWP